MAKVDSEMTQFYTYMYLSKDGTPYYVGKGKKSRAYISHRGHRPPKDRSRIKIQHWKSEEQSFEVEKLYIWFFGRKDLGTGILHNRTDGGEGTSGAVRSEETRRKMGAAKAGNTVWLGKKHSEETKDKISASALGNTRWLGKKHKRETLEKMSSVQIGHSVSEETKKKISDANRGKKRTEEQRAQIIANLTGRKVSEKTKEKMRQSRLAVIARTQK